ncbi:MAG TPA: hypothetical protein DDX09_03335 [Hyphomonas atlantica]|nr:hypothetical protein [Hyphomonas atlantica]|tara:strand:+ start:179 stop:484 length:306 start_codon:yes stop_codon:yes gene_type:complete
MKNGLAWLGITVAVIAVNLGLSMFQPYSESRILGLPLHLSLAALAFVFGLVMFASHRVYASSVKKLRAAGLTEAEIEMVSQEKDPEAKLREILGRKKGDHA